MTNKAYAAIQGFRGISLLSLSDAFTEGSLNTDLWTAYDYFASGTVATGGGFLQLELPSGISEQGVHSVSAYDLTGNQAMVMVPSTNQGEGSGQTTEVGFHLLVSEARPETVSSLSWEVDNGVLSAIYFTGSSPTTVTTVWTDSYSPGPYLWWRIGESGGNTYWDTSPDGVNWVNRATIPNPFDLTSLYAYMYGYNYESGDAANTVKFGAFDVSPLSGTGPGIVSATAVILSSDDSLVAYSGSGLPTVSAARFDYGASNEDIREALVAALRSDAGDDTLDVEFLTG